MRDVLDLFEWNLRQSIVTVVKNKESMVCEGEEKWASREAWTGIR